VGFAADKLYDKGRKVAAFGATEHILALGHELGAGNHLGDHETGAETMRELAERQIAHPGHRCEQYPVFQGVVADPERAHRKVPLVDAYGLGT
jgi:hypothetical protein